LDERFPDKNKISEYRLCWQLKRDISIAMTTGGNDSHIVRGIVPIASVAFGTSHLWVVSTTLAGAS
jgi:hypothetical protein